MIVAAKAFVGAKGVDTISTITAAQAVTMKSAGVDFAVRYLGSVTPAEMAGLNAAGIAVMLVTYGNQWDGPSAVVELQKLGAPRGCTVFLDLEGQTGQRSAVQVIGSCNAWATAIQKAGYKAGLYVGADPLLTSVELYALIVTCYWKGMSRICDRNGSLAEPACGWCVTQLFPTISIAGVNVDVDFIGEDYRGRLPTWCV